jgi:hypothetical protein
MIARRTLQAMVVIGTLTLLYQLVSLVPHFKARSQLLGGFSCKFRAKLTVGKASHMAFSQIVQTEWYAQPTRVSSTTDSIYQSQKQLLGPDCKKYVTMTPKAPPDIEKWVIDPLASNSSSSTLATRDTVLPPSEHDNALQFTTPGTEGVSAL